MKKVLENRNNRLGGSDITVLYGLSKFKTPFELALEKAGLKEMEQKPNIYGILGEVFEGKINKIMGNFEAEQIIIENNKGLDYVGNPDGLDKTKEKIVEIKTCKDKEKVIAEHENQVRYYMKLANEKGLDYQSVQFQIYERTESDKEEIKKIINKHKLNIFGEFENVDLMQEIAIRKDIEKVFQNKKLLKKDIVIKTIKRSEKKEDEMQEKIEAFQDFVKKLKSDIFFDINDKTRCEEKEKELKQALGLEIKLEEPKVLEKTKKMAQIYKIKQKLEEDNAVKRYLETMALEEKVKKEIKKEEEKVGLGYGKFNDKNVQIHVQKTLTLDKDKYIDDLEEMLEKVGITGYKEIEKVYKESKKIVIKEI